MQRSRSLRTPTKKDLNQIPPSKDFKEFLDGLKDVTETGIKFVDILNNLSQIQDTLESKDVLDEREVKSFGSYGAHIIVPSKFVGMKARVIIKSNNNKKKK